MDWGWAPEQSMQPLCSCCFCANEANHPSANIYNQGKFGLRRNLFTEWVFIPSLSVPFFSPEESKLPESTGLTIKSPFQCTDLAKKRVKQNYRGRLLALGGSISLLSVLIPVRYKQGKSDKRGTKSWMPLLSMASRERAAIAINYTEEESNTKI